MVPGTLRARWLGRVSYGEALALQRALFAGTSNHLLLLEHDPVYTLGVRADPANILVPPESVGAEVVDTDRGGDVTYHGPGQLTAYPIVSLPGKHGVAHGMADTVAYVTDVEQLVIDVLADLGLSGAGRFRNYPGVWIDPHTDRARKIAAIGIKLSRGRTMHGFALNVTDEPLAMFQHIVPCGIVGKPVTSIHAEGLTAVTMPDVVETVVKRAAERWGSGDVDDQRVAFRHRPEDLSPFSRGEGAGEIVRTQSVRLSGRLASAGVTDGLSIATRKPEWLRPKVRLDAGVLELKHTMRELGLVTVCEEAGCPNLSECWADGTATFMVLGERCTRACGFCLVDTSKPLPVDESEPERVAEAVDRMGLAHAVVTMVARDDLPDGGAAAVAATVRAIRERTPGCAVEVLISDLKGVAASLDVVVGSRPDVVNHNVETVPRLQRAVRPSAGYGRSLAVLARAKAAGLTTKSGLIVGMGERDDEVIATLADLAAIGTDIVTIGHYLRPTTHHLPVHRWVEPDTFERFAQAGEQLGIKHVESSPLTRSSYHARAAAERSSITH
jgi:lipoyl synthase